MKIQLISAPLISTFSKTIRASAFPPLNLVALASYIKKKMPSCSVEILDGEIYSTDEIINRLSGDLIGISANSLTYENALAIAVAAKKNSSKVVIGGPHADVVGKKILVKRPFIDFVVRGDGEKALLSLIKGDKCESIPNVVYRSGKKIIENSILDVPFHEMSLPDYSCHDVKPYCKHFREIYPHKPFKNPFAIFSSKGCGWRVRTKGCIFCAIPHNRFRIKKPDSVWNEIVYIYENFGGDFFWDVSDTFTIQKKWIKDFLKKKPTGLKVFFHVYARATDIDEEIAMILRKLGVYEVLVGFESGDDRILKNIGKGTTRGINIKAVKILNDNNINIIPSVILGLPGENKRSVQKTYDFVCEITKLYKVEEGYCSLVLPLPGSHMMAKLLTLSGLTHYIDADTFDLEELRYSWIKNYTSVSYDFLLEKQQEILSLFEISGSLARPQSCWEKGERKCIQVQ